MQIEGEGSEVQPGIVAVVGLGKIGLPLAVRYASRKWRVLGCEANTEVVEIINSGHTHVREEPGLASEVSRLVRQGLLSATCNTTAAVEQANVVVVIVAVQIDERHQVCFEDLDGATLAVGRGLRPGTLVIYETTLPVGTTEGRMRALLESASQLRAGREFFLAYSPERVSSGRIFRDLDEYPKVVGGFDARSALAATAFYRSVLSARIISMASCRQAEFVKLIETTYRDVNIALANEFACYADAHGLDVQAAIAGANGHPYAHIHMPGVGVGGHCIPVYPYFLLNTEERDQTLNSSECFPTLRLLREARRVNDSMAEYAVSRLGAALGSLWRRSVLLLGVAYRGDVRETAFSCVYRLVVALRQRGATVYVDDPLYSFDELRSLGFEPLAPGQEHQIEAIILQAAHSVYASFDFQRFTRCQVLLDGRYGLARAYVEEAGIRYIAPGDGAVEVEAAQYASRRR